MEAKEERLRKTITELQQHVSKLHENISENTSPNPAAIISGVEQKVPHDAIVSKLV